MREISLATLRRRTEVVHLVSRSQNGVMSRLSPNESDPMIEKPELLAQKLTFPHAAQPDTLSSERELTCADVNAALKQGHRIAL